MANLRTIFFLSDPDIHDRLLYSRSRLNPRYPYSLSLSGMQEYSLFSSLSLPSLSLSAKQHRIKKPVGIQLETNLVLKRQTIHPRVTQQK